MSGFSTILLTFDHLDIGNDSSRLGGVPRHEVEGIRIFNRTGDTGYFLYISPSGDPQWGEDKLREWEVLEHNASTWVNLQGYGATFFDIRLETASGEEYVVRSVDLRSASRFTIGPGTMASNW